MKKLSNYVRKNGYDYHLIDRDDHVAIYEQIGLDWQDQKFSVAFEVFEIAIFVSPHPNTDRYATGVDIEK